MTRVGIQPVVHAGACGYRVRARFADGCVRSWFVHNMFAARDAKARIKAGKRPLGWAVLVEGSMRKAKQRAQQRAIASKKMRSARKADKKAKRIARRAA